MWTHHSYHESRRIIDCQIIFASQRIERYRAPSFAVVSYFSLHTGLPSTMAKPSGIDLWKWKTTIACYGRQEQTSGNSDRQMVLPEPMHERCGRALKSSDATISPTRHGPVTALTDCIWGEDRAQKTWRTRNRSLSVFRNDLTVPA